MEVLVMDELEMEPDACPVCGLPVPAARVMWWTDYPDLDGSRPLHDGCVGAYFGLMVEVR